MAHKTITISDDAYEALAKPRRERVFHEGDTQAYLGERQGELAARASQGLAG